MKQEITKHALWINTQDKILRVSSQSINFSSCVFRVYGILKTMLLSKIKTLSTAGDLLQLHGLSCTVEVAEVPPLLQNAKSQGTPLLKESTPSTGEIWNVYFPSSVNTNKSEEKLRILMLQRWALRWDEASPGLGMVEEYCHLLAWSYNVHVQGKTVQSPRQKAAPSVVS